MSSLLHLKISIVNSMPHLKHLHVCCSQKLNVIKRKVDLNVAWGVQCERGPGGELGLLFSVLCRYVMLI